MAVDIPNPDLPWVYFVELTPFDPNAGENGAEISLYWATQDVFFDGADPDAPNREYNGIVDVALSVTQGIEIGAGEIRPDGQPDYGGITIAIDDELALDAASGLPWLKTLAFDERPVRVLRGLPPKNGAPWRYADLTEIWRGTGAGGEDWGGATIATIPIGGFGDRLDRDFSTETYAGTGGFEGGADVKGKLKARAIGVINHAPARLIDAANEWWDVAPVDGFDAGSDVKVYQGAYEYDYDASSPPAAGKVYIDHANGRIQTNGMPVLPLTVSFTSAFGGGAVTAADTLAEALTNDLGFDAGELNTGTFDDLNTATDAPVSLFIEDPISGSEVIGRILGSVGAYHTENAGKFDVYRFEAPTAESADDEDVDLLITDDDIERGSFKLLPAVIPPYRIDFQYARCWTKFSLTDIATDAADSDREFVLQPYRIAPDGDPAVLTLHRKSKPAAVESDQADAAASTAEVARRKAMFCVDQEFAAVTVMAAPFKLRSHAQVWVQSDFNDVDCAWRAINVRQQSKSGKIPLVLWRPKA